MRLLCLFATIALGLGLTAAVVWGAVGAMNAASEVNWDYKGITYVSWTRGDYPWTTSWKPQTYTDSQAIKVISITTDCAHSGIGGLEMAVDLVGSHPNKSNGEVFVDFGRSGWRTRLKRIRNRSVLADPDGGTT